MWRTRGKERNNHHNLSLDWKIDYHSNPLTAELFYSANADLKLAGKPQCEHSPEKTFPCGGWRGT